jgi:hypothetical protein
LYRPLNKALRNNTLTLWEKKLVDSLNNALKKNAWTRMRIYS